HNAHRIVLKGLSRRMIPRRRFVQGLTAGLLLSPRVSVGQPVGKAFRIGVLSIANRPQGPAMDAFRRGLREHGYVEGQTFVIEYRAAGDTPDRYPELVAELVRLNVDVIVALGTPPAIAAKQGTATIPIVMVFVSDPVTSGLVQSLARP